MGKALDLTNQKFGKLTVIKQTNLRNSSGQIIWECKCDCGNTYNAVGADLKRGKTTHCGCGKDVKIKYQKIKPGDYINNKQIIEDTGLRRPTGTIIWKCKCDCGNIYNATSSEIHRQQKCEKCKKTSENLIGRKFGKLTVISQEPSKNGHAMWKCKCECGGIIVKDTTSLKNGGEYQGCGCVKSIGEETIAKLLTDNNIDFVKQKTFEGCVINTGKAIFDFYVNNKYLIEYDGIQHFKALGGWSDENGLENNQIRDNIKNQYCKNNNIPLIRIPYTHLKDLCIEDLLLETSSFLI